MSMLFFSFSQYFLFHCIIFLSEMKSRTIRYYGKIQKSNNNNLLYSILRKFNEKVLFS